MSLIFGIDLDQKRQRKDGRNVGQQANDDSLVDTFVSNYTSITKLANWETMSMSTAQGGAAVNSAYYGSIFDGRYIYFGCYSSLSFIRFDTTQLFQTAAAWEKMSHSTVYGHSQISVTRSGVFDGRYVYFAPDSSTTFVRFDTTQGFTVVGAWEKASASSVLGVSVGASASLYWGAGFDGRYVYFAPQNSDTFVRYDTFTSLFTVAISWEKMSMSTAQGAAVLDSAYPTCLFDGRYIYFVPLNSDTFLKYDTTLSFTNSSAWSRISMSTIVGASPIDTAFLGGCFDGRYIYYSPLASNTHIRFDTTKLFTNSLAWEKISISTAQGSSMATYAYVDTIFDGRYVHYGSAYVRTMIRFDTTQLFVNSSAWNTVSMSTVLGAAGVDDAFVAPVFDGKYVYFTASSSDTFLRVLANPSKRPYKG